VALTIGLQLPVLEAWTEGDFEPAFAKLVELRAGALLPCLPNDAMR
jgi:hypothetical protein